jgi:hypothetical protein
VRLWTGTERFARSWNPDVRGDDRLLYTSQTAWERSRNIIRSAEAHDPPSASDKGTPVCSPELAGPYLSPPPWEATWASCRSSSRPAAQPRTAGLNACTAPQPSKIALPEAWASLSCAACPGRAGAHVAFLRADAEVCAYSQNTQSNSGERGSFGFFDSTTARRALVAAYTCTKRYLTAILPAW